MDSLTSFIKRNKNYDDKQAMKSAYQVRLFLRSLIYCVLLCIILSYFGLFKDCIVLFICFKFYRGFCGGIHLKGYIVCFISSMGVLLSVVSLSRFVVLSLTVECVVWFFILLIWFLFVPQGTSQRPIRRADEKRTMKINMGVMLIITFCLRFISTEIYALSVWSLSITLLLITPLAYSLFKVRHDRI